MKYERWTKRENKVTIIKNKSFGEIIEHLAELEDRLEEMETIKETKNRGIERINELSFEVAKFKNKAKFYYELSKQYGACIYDNILERLGE